MSTHKTSILLAFLLTCGCIFSYPTITSAMAGFEDRHTMAITIDRVFTTTPEIRQGGLLTLVLQLESSHDLRNLTAEFSIVNKEGEEVALLASDFFPIQPTHGSVHRFNFRWTDLNTARSGSLNISRVRIRQHRLESAADEKDLDSAVTIAERPVQLALQVTPVTDPVERMYVSRENSRWWVSEMGPVDTRIARDNGLQNCIMFGGTEASWIRNDALSRAGSDGLCYWEITGYAIRMLALEYERSGEPLYLNRAMDIADAVVRNIRRDDEAPFPSGSLPTFNHYDGRIGEWFKDKAMLFDHGQIVMGLLELIRVLDEKGILNERRTTFEQTARSIGNFMLASSRQKNGKLPEFWPRNSRTVSENIEQTSKVVIGFNQLGLLMRNEEFKITARQHLDEMLQSSPGANHDHHGRSYMGYGFLRAFRDYGDQKYMNAAVEWTASVANELDDAGRLLPLEEYSVIPAQSQLIRNAALLWELTGKNEYMQWADKSASFLTQSPDAWTYRQPLLKLGRFFREAGALYNNSPTDELCSWATIFHVDAMYHYLRMKYGHVYIGPESHISMIGPVDILEDENRIELRLEGITEENIGIHFAGDRHISLVEIDRQPFAYHSANSARLPPFKGTRKVVVHFNKEELPRLVSTNSLVETATLTTGKALDLRLRGQAGTDGKAKLFWPSEILHITLDDRFLPDERWQWDASSKQLVIDYPHKGTEQRLRVTPRR